MKLFEGFRYGQNDAECLHGKITFDKSKMLERSLCSAVERRQENFVQLSTRYRQAEKRGMAENGSKILLYIPISFGSAQMQCYCFGRSDVRRHEELHSLTMPQVQQRFEVRLQIHWGELSDLR